MLKDKKEMPKCLIFLPENLLLGYYLYGHFEWMILGMLYEKQIIDVFQNEISMWKKIDAHAHKK